MSSNPVSPSVHAEDSAVDEHEDSPEMTEQPDVGQAHDSEQENASQNGDDAEDDDPYYVIYQKKCYIVPQECIIFNRREPVVVKDGTKMGEVHDTKAYRKWVKAHITWRNMIIVAAKINEEVQMHMYVTFDTDRKSDDAHILRPVHKAVIKAYMTYWNSKWSEDRKQKEQFRPFTEFVLGTEAQISPERHRWERVTENEPETVYVKKTSTPRANEQFRPEVKGKKAAAKTAPRAIERDENPKEDPPHCNSQSDAEMEESNTADTNAVSSGTSSGTNGATVVVPQQLFEKMAARYWGSRSPA